MMAKQQQSSLIQSLSRSENYEKIMSELLNEQQWVNFSFINLAVVLLQHCFIFCLFLQNKVGFLF